jgi:hypothetical protein
VTPEETGASPVGHPIDAGDLAINGASYALQAGSIPAPATTWACSSNGRAAPLQGDGCRFESDLVHAHADVAQREEARRSDRRGCGFDSHRQYHLDVAQRQRTGFGSRGLEVRALPSRRNARWWNWYHAWL